jgi:hypothetical protein
MPRRQVASVSKRNTKTKLGLACCLLVGASGFVVWRIASNPLVLNDLHALPAISRPDRTFDASLDPPLGTRIEGFLGNTRGKKPRLLVVAGTCSSCSLRAFDPRTLKTDDYAEVGLVYFASADEIDPAIKRLVHSFRIISDPKAELAQKLNVGWWPRFYLFSSSGGLMDLQRSPTTMPSFVHLKGRV